MEYEETQPVASNREFHALTSEHLMSNVDFAREGVSKALGNVAGFASTTEIAPQEPKHESIESLTPHRELMLISRAIIHYRDGYREDRIGLYEESTPLMPEIIKSSDTKESFDLAA
ncbi:MAG: hypothetical protein ABIR91_05175 [Candidatus Saccharimonadales bacterium]